jgi:polar amino acid transport system substrate-binding protein
MRQTMVVVKQQELRGDREMQWVAPTRPRGPGMGVTTVALIVTAVLPLVMANPADAASLDRIREAGKLTLGYRVDARPFSYQDASGQPTGYSVALCLDVAEEIKTELSLADMAVDWIPVTVDDRFQMVAEGKVNILCGAATETLTRREQVSFSIAIFPGGIGAILRTEGTAPLQEVLLGRPPSGPIWRASPARILESKTFSVVKGTSAESWLSERLDNFQLTANVVPVENYDAGVEGVINGDSNVFFGERSVLLETAAERSGLTVLDRLFTYEPIALAIERNDDDFRLVVDRALSRIFRSEDFRDLYAKWFGAPDESVATFFRQSALPQ